MSDISADAAAAERAARRARILSRGADRMALVKGEVTSLPAIDEAAVAAAVAASTAASAAAASALAATAAMEASASAAAAAAASAAAAAALAAPSSASTAPLAEPAPAAAALAPTPVTAATPAPPPASITPTIPAMRPAAAPRATSLAAALAGVRRRQRAALMRALFPVLLGVLLSYAWWSCGEEALPLPALQGAHGGWGGASPRSLALSKLRLEGSGEEAEGAAADAERTTRVAGEPPAARALLALTRVTPAWVESLGVCESGGWAMPLVLAALLAARGIAALAGGGGEEAGAGALGTVSALIKGVGAGRGAMGVALKLLPAAASAAGALRAAWRDALTVVVVVVVGSALLRVAPVAGGGW